MGDESVDVVETVPVVELPEEGTLLAEPDQGTNAIFDALVAELSKGDLIAVADKVEVSVPAMPPTDLEVQAALDVAAPGAYFRNRCNLGPAVDTFVVGGVFAPGRQRWVQTNPNDSAQKQAEAIRDALI